MQPRTGSGDSSTTDVAANPSLRGRPTFRVTVNDPLPRYVHKYPFGPFAGPICTRSSTYYAGFAQIYVEFRLMGCFVTARHHDALPTSARSGRCTSSRWGRNGSPLATRTASPPGARNGASP